MERLGESKASNPVYQDFVTEMEKAPTTVDNKKNEGGGGGWFSSSLSYLWASGEAIRYKKH